MNEPKHQPGFQEDEFDIEVLASKLWRLNKKLLQKALYPIKLVFTDTKKLIFSVSIALAVSVILRFTIPPVYETSFTIMPGNPLDQVGLGMLDDLETLLNDKNTEQLSQALQLDATTCDNLYKVSYEVSFKNPVRKDSINYIQVRLLLRNPTLVDTFQHAIVTTYLEHSEYFKRLVQIRQQELDYMENLLLNDISENDSLKRIVTSSVVPRSSGGFVYGEPLDPQHIYQSGYKLQEQLVKLRSNKAFNQSFFLVKEGIVRRKPYFPRIVIIFPVFAFLAFIYCAVTNYRKISAQ